MEIEGKITQFLQPVSGQGSNGPWKKQEFIIETLEKFPKKLCIANWNDKVTVGLGDVDKKFRFHINAESREFNGKWYTDIRLWKIEPLSSNPKSQSSATSEYPIDNMAPPPSSDGLPWDDSSDGDEVSPF